MKVTATYRGSNNTPVIYDDETVARVQAAVKTINSILRNMPDDAKHLFGDIATQEEELTDLVFEGIDGEDSGKWLEVNGSLCVSTYPIYL